MKKQNKLRIPRQHRGRIRRREILMRLGLLLLLRLVRTERLGTLRRRNRAERGRAVRRGRQPAPVFGVGALVQRHLVVAADRHLDLVAGIAEQILGVVVRQIARIVLIDLGDDVPAEQLLLGRGVYLDLWT